jgi:outer membrane protein assembly factor BamA
MHVTFRPLAAVMLAVALINVSSQAGAASNSAADKGATADLITEIRFAGNKRTRARTMLQEMLVRPGDPADPDKVERSRQAIMDLGLFNSVEAELLPDPRGKILQISVDEKTYTLPLPVLSRNADGDITYGARLRMDNLHGLNQTLDVQYKIKQVSDNDLDDEKQASIEYVYPRVGGSPYQIEFLAEQQASQNDEVEDGAEARYDEDISTLRVRVARWFGLRGPSHGWRINAGLLWNDIDRQFVSGTPGLLGEGTVVTLLTGIEFTDVRDYLYSRAGVEYGYDLAIADESLGSDESFTKHEVYYRAYMPVLKHRPHTNLNVQLRMGTASRSLFGEEFFSVGGSDSLRGFDRDDIKGNAYVLGNVEFLTPIFGERLVRGVLFADVGNAYDSFSDIDLGDLKTGVGVGLRWKVKTFVKVDVRVDAAYATDTGDSKLYVGTDSTF